MKRVNPSGFTVQFVLEATPELVGRLLALPEPQRLQMQRALWAAALRIIGSYLPADMLGRPDGTQPIFRAGPDVMLRYQHAFGESREALARLGLMVEQRGFESDNPICLFTGR